MRIEFDFGIDTTCLIHISLKMVQSDIYPCICDPQKSCHWKASRKKTWAFGSG